MVRIVPPSSRNFFSCGTVFAAVMLPRWSAVRRSGPAGSSGRAPPSGRSPPPTCRRRARRGRYAPSTRISTSNLSRRPPLSSSGGVDQLERELELLEQPARPAGRHRPAVAVPQADADRLERHGLLAGRGGAADGTACRARRRSFPARGSVVVLRRDEEHPGRVLDARPTVTGSCKPADFLARLQEPVHGPERVVEPRLRKKPDGVLGVDDLAGGGGTLVLDLLERAVEAVEDAVELHAHLEGRACSRRSRRAESAGRRGRRSRSGGPAARTCRARGRGTPGAVFTT